ncbi:MAG: hypothetical protein COB59_07690 [Rhodospirillaceae bacterium]|nr:MAG: hypothetical protein COB59_07690 [Rhodospirillaceae bacterium]
MAGFFDVLISHSNKNKSRAEQFSVLKATMAGAALISMADNDLKRGERYATQKLIQKVTGSKLYREDDGMGLFEDYIKKLQNDRTTATTEILNDIAAVKDSPEDATMVIVLCKTISSADRDICPEELTCLDQICTLLELDCAAIKAIKVPDF